MGFRYYSIMSFSVHIGQTNNKAFVDRNCLMSIVARTYFCWILGIIGLRKPFPDSLNSFCPWRTSRSPRIGSLHTIRVRGSTLFWRFDENLLPIIIKKYMLLDNLNGPSVQQRICHHSFLLSRDGPRIYALALWYIIYNKKIIII